MIFVAEVKSRLWLLVSPSPLTLNDSLPFRRNVSIFLVPNVVTAKSKYLSLLKLPIATTFGLEFEFAEKDISCLKEPLPYPKSTPILLIP